MTNVGYADRIVIITGGSSGIGKACAEQFVNAGAKVVICCNDADEGQEVATTLRAVGQRQGCGDADFIYCDVTRTDNIRDLIETSISRYGRIDCLINNAGWHPPHKPIDDFSVQEFRDLLDLNLVSIFTASKFALPYLRRTKGNIINMSSLVASIGQRYATTYVATKGAITAFTKALAVDEAPHGVRVNSVSPGNIMTPLWQEAIDAAAAPEEYRAEGEAAQLVGRMGRAEEVGRLCLFIAAEATFTTGVDHIISGGAELGYGQKSMNGKVSDVELVLPQS